MTWQLLDPSPDASGPSPHGLQQGDVLQRCRVTRWDARAYGQEGEIDVRFAEMTLIILTQSCDLFAEQNPVENVTLCRLLSAADLLGMTPASGSGDWSKDQKKKLENIRRGHVNRYHMLRDWYQLNNPHSVWIADFSDLTSLPYGYLLRHAAGQHRPRLMSPYREHFSQAYARYHMRVGLPSDIPPFK